MTEYTIHFQKGSRIGTRSLRMVHVEAGSAFDAIKAAKLEFSEAGYRIVRVDHFEDGRIVIDQ